MKNTFGACDHNLLTYQLSRKLKKNQTNRPAEYLKILFKMETNKRKIKEIIKVFNMDCNGEETECERSPGFF